MTASLEPSVTGLTFVTAMFKGDSGAAPGHFAVKGGDATAGELTVYWDGPRPKGYAPMKKQGAIILVGGSLCTLGPVKAWHLPLPPQTRA